MTLRNMTVEAGARGALIAPDATTLNYVRAHANLDAAQRMSNHESTSHH
jgi:3-isopropylmalate/(R)-2-methylmalate dehydratase large subunit